MGSPNHSNRHRNVILVAPVHARRELDRSQYRIMPIRAGQHPGNDVRHVENTSPKKNFFNAFVIPTHHQEPHQGRAHRHGNVFADVE